MRNTASMAAMSDPDRNRHFRHRWLEPPALERERPPRLTDLRRATIETNAVAGAANIAPPAPAAQRALVRVDRTRQEALEAFRDWLATGPDPAAVAADIEAMASAARQLAALEPSR